MSTMNGLFDIAAGLVKGTGRLINTAAAAGGGVVGYQIGKSEMPTKRWFFAAGGAVLGWAVVRQLGKDIFDTDSGLSVSGLASDIDNWYTDYDGPGASIVHASQSAGDWVASVVHNIPTGGGWHRDWRDVVRESEINRATQVLRRANRNEAIQFLRWAQSQGEETGDLNEVTLSERWDQRQVAGHWNTQSNELIYVPREYAMNVAHTIAYERRSADDWANKWHYHHADLRNHPQRLRR